MPQKLAMELRDAKNDRAEALVHLDITGDPGDNNLGDGIQQMMSLVNILTQDAVLASNLTEHFISNYTLAPDATADVQERARFRFRTEDGALAQVTVSCIDESIFVPLTGNVDLSNPQVAQFVTAMIDGWDQNGLTFTPTDARGNRLIALIDAVEAWGKARK